MIDVDRRGALLHVVNGTSPSNQPHLVPISIAGVRVDLKCDTFELCRRISSLFMDYQSGSPAEAVLHIREVAPPSYFTALWEDPDPEFNVQGDWVFQRDFAAKKISDHEAIACLSPGENDAVYNLLRWFYPNLLLKKGAFLMHATAVVRDGKGYVFFGQSGAGKSTTATLISKNDPCAMILGDDAAILSVNSLDHQAFVHSAPLGTGNAMPIPRAMTAPLAGLFALKQAPITKFENIPASQGVAALLASAMSVNHEDFFSERWALALKFSQCGTGIRRLCFHKSPEFWDLILKNECNRGIKDEPIQRQN